MNQVLVGSRVRITAMGITVEGEVVSVDNIYIHDGMPGQASHIGYQPYGIQVRNHRTEQVHYWKCIDGGSVRLEVDGVWNRVYPRLPLEGWTSIERGIADKVFREYFGREAGYDLTPEKGYDNAARDAIQYQHILDLVRDWSAEFGLGKLAEYDTALDIARKYHDPFNKSYVQDVRSAYNKVMDTWRGP